MVQHHVEEDVCLIQQMLTVVRVDLDARLVMAS
jgi:hypothetical protein